MTARDARAPNALDELATPELRNAFAREVADVNLRRMRVIGPIMIVVHLLHVAIFGFAATRSDVKPSDLLALHDLVIVHGTMVPVTSLMTAMVYWMRRPAIGSLMGPLVVTVYLVHGAISTACALQSVQSLTTYVGYCLALAVMFLQPLRQAIAAYAIGLVALVVSLWAIVPAAQVFVSTMPTCTSITAVCVGLAAVLYRGRRREFRQRLTIERQRDELETLNTELEHRVTAQVGEIVARASEVEQLNAQLQAQVRERSSELSLALARLAQQRQQTSGPVQRGTVLGGRFVVGDVIGEGGMGAVYAGTDRITGAQVALKLVQATSTRTLETLRRFAREAGTAAAVTHPAVVRMIDVDISDDGLLFQAQELVDGEPLARRVKRAWRPADAARLGAVLCDALAAAHAVGVVHRDVKPENIMLTAGAPGLKLLDFGIAKLHAAVQGTAETVTSTGAVIGTPAYMAPEQALGDEVTDRADVYAAGVILFRLLCGRLPFEAESAAAIVILRELNDAPRVRVFQPSVPEPLAELVDRCLARRAEDRPSAADLASRLAACADDAGAPPLELAAERDGDETATGSPVRDRDATACGGA